MPRVAIARSVTVEPDARARLATIARRAPGSTDVVVESSLPIQPRGGSARIVSDEPDRVVVETDTPAAGLVVLRDVKAPGWHASVDGKAATIVPVDHAFRGIVVPAGTSRVTFDYEPFGSTKLAFLLGIVGAIGLGITLRRVDRKTAPASVIG
jgi:hypothetical protein